MGSRQPPRERRPALLQATNRQLRDVVVIARRPDLPDPSGDSFEEGPQVLTVLRDRLPQHRGQTVQPSVEVLVTACRTYDA
jgi:hypothetical protein